MRAPPPAPGRCAVAVTLLGAEGRAALICNPLDLLKTRLQVQGSAFRSAAHASVEYSGISDALGKMVRTEGVRGMWKGTVVRRTHTHTPNRVTVG